MTTILLRNGLLATYTKSDAPNSVPAAHHADILIKNGRIAQIASAGSLPVQGEVIDCTDKIVAPGFIDTHRHLYMAVVEGLEDLTLHEYLAEVIFTKAKLITPEDIYIGSYAGSLQSLNAGTTTIVDHFHCFSTPDHLNQAVRAAITSGTRTIFCPSRSTLPTQLEPHLAWGEEADAIEWQMKAITDLARHPPAHDRFTLGFGYDRLGQNPDVDRKILEQVRALGLKPISVHVLGPPRGGPPPSIPTKWVQAGHLQSDVLFSHCTGIFAPADVAEREWSLLRDHDVGVSATPEIEMNCGLIDPIPYEAVRHGVRCGLGTDVVATEMFTGMRMALAHNRSQISRQAAPKVPKYNPHPVATAFRLATLGGAEALHLETELGSIEVGKWADIVIYDALSPNLAHTPDPFKAIVVHASVADVETVLVGGHVVKRKGQLVDVDWGTTAKTLRAHVEGVRDRAKEFDVTKRYETVLTQLHIPINE